jgi:hypothetical protein
LNRRSPRDKLEGHVQTLSVFRPAVHGGLNLGVNGIEFRPGYAGFGGHVGECVATGRGTERSGEKPAQFTVARVAGS